MQMVLKLSSHRGTSFLALLAFALAAPSALGVPGYTPVNPPVGGLEAAHAEILELIYGGTFGASGPDFDNGTVSALRVFDFDGGVETLNLLTGDQTGIDQIWTDGVASVTAEAKYALFSQSFGWNGGGLGTTFSELLTDADIGGSPVNLNIAGDFLWGLNPNTPETWWTKDSENSDAADHSVTYLITGLPSSKTVWLQFWDDADAVVSDRDFNDFVVEIRAIPEPATALLLLLGGLHLSPRKRR